MAEISVSYEKIYIKNGLKYQSFWKKTQKWLKYQPVWKKNLKLAEISASLEKNPKMAEISASLGGWTRGRGVLRQQLVIIFGREYNTPSGFYCRLCP